MTATRVCAALLVLVAACAGSEQTADTTAAAQAGSADRATKAAAVSDALAANPAQADSILSANGFTREQFQKEMYEIAADSSLSAAYAAAKTR